MESVKSAFCIAGTHSGCGKTTVALGIMAALVRRGLKVQAFKVGPDFIDPGHHRRVTGRDSHNLDGWMLAPEYNREVFHRYFSESHVAVVEGVMGLFDGFSGTDESGSTAQMAKLLQIPVILIVDARAMARSAAAMALGYSRFDPELNLQGIIFNKVAGERHANYLKEAMQTYLPEVPVFGCLVRDHEIEMPSRHLGLVTDEDNPLGKERVERLTACIERGVDLDRILKECRFESRDRVRAEERVEENSNNIQVPIGIAMDQAFCFYYAENLRLLREAGALLKSFSPLRDEGLPQGVQGLVFGGGYPELYSGELSKNKALAQEIRGFVRKGGAVYAECGGFMYLTKAIVDLEGREHPMVGVFPVRTKMSSELNSLGYREVATTTKSPLGPEGTVARGHEFHYSYTEGIPESLRKIYKVRSRKDSQETSEGFLVNRAIGSYIHLHWGSNPQVPVNFIKYCKEGCLEAG